MELTYQLIFPKRKSITITMDRDRSVNVRAPLGTLEETPEFWNIAAVQAPRYERSRSWLRSNGTMLEEDFSLPLDCWSRISVSPKTDTRLCIDEPGVCLDGRGTWSWRLEPNDSEHVQGRDQDRLVDHVDDKRVTSKEAQEAHGRPIRVVGQVECAAFGCVERVAEEDAQ